MSLNFTNEEARRVLDLRRALHQNPEPGNEETFATDLILKTLSSLGIETLRPLATGCVGVLKGGLPGPRVAFRADIDALPVTEETGVSFASLRPGCMHACGHDVHTAALLGAATLLVREKDRLPGTVLFVFQPDEEGDGGAARLLDSGVLDGVDRFFGCHVSPDLPAGTVGVRYGKFYAAADTFDAVFFGRGCHGATPEKGADALAAAALSVPRLKALPAEFLPERAVVNVGSFHAGTVRNIVADRAEIMGIIRTLGEETRAAMGERVSQTLSEAAAAYGAAAELTLRRGYPGVVNHDRETALVEERAAALFGPEKVVRIETPTMTTEDFGFYLQKAPGSFYHVGVGGEEPLHSPRFLPPEETVLTAARLHAALALGVRL